MCSAGWARALRTRSCAIWVHAGENGSRIVFYFSAFSCLVCLPLLLLDYEPLSLRQLVYLLLAGAFACVGQLGITKAYVCAPAKEISVYDYTQVIFAAALGFFRLWRGAGLAQCSGLCAHLRRGGRHVSL